MLFTDEKEISFLDKIVRALNIEACIDIDKRVH
jgi:hypothetical protein